MTQPNIKPFLKWPGRKYNILAILQRHLANFSDYETLVEPFVGSGTIFLNTNYKKYILNDCNLDLIDTYNYLIRDGEKFIKLCSEYFNSQNNSSDRYYELRQEFNQLRSSAKKSAIFLYLNRHGYNGLCRYNSSGGYNVPFGSYVNIYFPFTEMKLFHDKSNSIAVKITAEDFNVCFKKIKPNSIVYCDPPYVPISQTSSFTKYVKTDFDFTDQEKLVELVMLAKLNNVSSVISNHDLAITRKLYQDAEIISFDVRRAISCKVNNRNLVKELLAIYDSKKL